MLSKLQIMDIKAAEMEAGQTFAELIETVGYLEDSELNKVPFEGSWTAGQVVQHVILSAGGFVHLLNGPTIDSQRDPEASIPMIKGIFLNFSTKMKSPDSIDPEEKDYSKMDLINTLNTIKLELSKSISTLDTSKICMLYEIPTMGNISRAEAIIFVTVHTQRHIHQLKNILKQLT